MNFSTWLGRNIVLGLSLIVLIGFLRNIIPFDIRLVIPVFATTSAIHILVRRPSIPKPTKSDIMPFIASLSISTILAFYFAKFPYFPDFPSIDMKSHADVIDSMVISGAPGGIGDIPSQLLYYAYRYIFVALASIIPIPTLFTIRYGMAVMLAFSPFVFYDFGVSVFKNHRTAWMIALFWAVSGLWVSIVLYSGLLPNFYSWLAALFLISVTCDFISKKMGVSSLVLWSLAFFNALFSHYTILFALVPLAFFALLQSRKERFFRNGIMVSASILGVISIGVLLTGTFSTLLGFLGSSQFPFADTDISAFIPLSIFRFFFALVGNDWLTGLIMMPSFALFTYFAIKRRALPWLLILAWFGLIVVTAPLDFMAWRFAIAAFLPLCIMCGQVLSLPMMKLRRISLNIPRVGLIAFLMFFPIFTPSYGSVVVTSDSRAAQQGADYQAMRWINENVPPNVRVANASRIGGENIFMAMRSPKTHQLLALNDRDFIYQQVFPISPNVFFAADYHTIIQVPTQASYLAANLSADYIIVSRNGTVPVFPTPKPFDIFLTANATEIRPTMSVDFTLASRPKITAPFVLLINNLPEIVWLNNGSGSITIRFIDAGSYSVFAQSVPNGAVSTFPMTITVGLVSKASAQTVGLPSDFYSPWWSFSSYTLGGAKLVYSSDYVHIFKVTR